MNRYTKLIKSLKETAPTNSMSGVYSLNAPGHRVGPKDRLKRFYPDIDGNFTDGVPGNPGDPYYERPEGYWNGGSEWSEDLVPDASQDYLGGDPTGKSTNDLIAEDGTVKTFLPPNSRHFILGPLVDGYVQNHGYDNYTNIGYIQKDTRQFVLLARIQGQFTANLHSNGARVWDGTESQLTSYNSNFTLEMAEWFRDQITAGTSTSNVPYFYSGGVPQPPLNILQCPECPPNMFGGVTPGTVPNGGFGTGTPPNIGTLQEPSQSGNQTKAKIFNLTPDQVRTLAILLGLGLSIAAVIAVLFPEPASSAAGAGYLASKFRFAAGLKKSLGQLWKAKPKTYKKIEYPKPTADEILLRNVNRATQRPVQRSTTTRTNPKKRFPVGDSYDHITDVEQKLILEAFLNETAPTGSGADGGTQLADVYVDQVSQEYDTDQLQQASDDANDLAGDKGLTDKQKSDIDKEAEDLAKELNNVDYNNPESWSREQISNFYDMVYSTDPEWLEQNFDQYEYLIDKETSLKAYEDYKAQREYISSDEFAGSVSPAYISAKDICNSLWDNHFSRGWDLKRATITKDNIPSWWRGVIPDEGETFNVIASVWSDTNEEFSSYDYDLQSEWIDNWKIREREYNDVVWPAEKEARAAAEETYRSISDEASREFHIAMINAWNQRNVEVDDDPYSLDDIAPGDIASMSEAEKEELRKTLMKLGISYGDIASVDVMNLGVDATAAVLSLGVYGLVQLYNVTTSAATDFINAVSTAGSLDSQDYDNPYTRERDKSTTEKKGDAERKGDAVERGQSADEKQEKADAAQELEDATAELEAAYASGDEERIERAEERRENAVKNKQRVRNKWKNQKNLPGYKGESYKPKFLNNRERKSITEVGVPNQKRILREIKKPVVIDEGPTKFKVKPTGRKNKSVGSTMMNKVETPLTYKPVNNIWSKKDKARNIRASQERKNQVLELVGAAEHHWTYLTEDRRKKRQEKVNEMMSAEFDKSLELMYENYKKSIDGKAEKLVNKIRTKVKPEYPKTPPPQLDPETGMHPKYGKKYKHDKLDPHSAEAMPPTGDPVIDANAKKAHDPVQKARKLKILQGKSKSKTFENFDNLSKKKIYEDIAIEETKYLRYFIENSSVPKHYDWELGEFNELPEINKVVLKRLETIENALSEGMTTKDFKYLYGGVITNDIVSLNPNLVSSTFAHDLVSTSSEVTSHMFGPDFPGSYINSIGDFNPQSYSKVDVVATASWNSIQDVTPSGWTPENSYEYVDSVSDVVTPGQESDVFKDTLFGEVTVTGTDFSLSTGDDEDPSQENTVDIADLETLFPGVTFPTGHPIPGETDREPPYEASMLLRTFKSIKVGQEITFNYSFASAETEEDGDITYRGVSGTDVPGDDGNMDDYAFVLIAGRVQKIVSVMARDGNNIDFNFQPNADDYYKPDVLQSRFPLTGRYRYTVKSDDIDDYGNLKLFVGVMDAGDGSYESNLDVTNFKLDSSRLAAGQLGKTTDAYNLGTSVASLNPNKKKGKKKDRKKKKNTFAERWGLPDDYQDRFRRAHGYFINNIGKIDVPMGLGFATRGVAEKVDELFDKSLAKQGFTKKQIETIKKNKLLVFTSKKNKSDYSRTVERWEKEREEREKRRQQEYDRRPKIGAKLTSIRDITSPEKREMLGKILAGTNIPYDKSRFTTPKKQSKGSSSKKLKKGTGGIQAPSQKQFTLSDKGDLSKNLNDKYGYKTTEKDKWMDNYAAKVARGEEPVPPVPRGNAAADPIGDLMTVGPVATAAAKALIGTVGIAAGSAITKGARVLDQFAKWWNKGKNVRVDNEDTASLWNLFTDDVSQLTRSDAAFKSGQTGLKTLRPFKSVLDPKMRATGPTPLIRQGGRVLTKPLGPTLGARNESYDLIFEQVDPDDKFFQELQKVIVKLKKPEQVEKLSKFLKKVSKAKEKSESRNAEENNSNALYPGQPSPNGFPDTPPPKMAPNGYHPEFGKRENRYRRLDPHSAESMPLTGDPKTDANVKKARDDVQKVRKLKNLIGKMKTSS